MSVVSFEGIVENGRIRLEPGVRLPENTKVYVLVPGLEVKPTAQLRSPRLSLSSWSSVTVRFADLIPSPRPPAPSRIALALASRPTDSGPDD